jgi:hypothetical protein
VLIGEMNNIINWLGAKRERELQLKGGQRMGTGLLALLFLATVIPCALAARWHAAFGILGVCVLMTSLFYGWIWLLERKAIHDLQERYGHLDIYPKDHLPRGWHSIVKDFETHVLLMIWLVGVLLFLAKLVSDLGRR